MLSARKDGNHPYISIRTQLKIKFVVLIISLHHLINIQCCQHASEIVTTSAINSSAVGFRVKSLTQSLDFPDIYFPHLKDLSTEFWAIRHKPLRTKIIILTLINPCLIDFKITKAKYTFFSSLPRDSFKKVTVTQKKIPSRSNSLLQKKGIPEALVQDEEFEIEKMIAHYLRLCNLLQSHSYYKEIPSLNSSEKQTINIHTPATHIDNIKKLMHEHNINIRFADNSNSTLLYLACEHGAFDAIPLFLELAQKQKFLITQIKRNNGKTPLDALNKLSHTLQRQAQDETLAQRCNAARELLINFKI